MRNGGGTIVRCQTCQRLIIRGQRCVCDAPRRPQEPPQSDERAEVVPASTPRGFCTCKPHGPMPDCGFAEHRALARNPHGETPR